MDSKNPTNRRGDERLERIRKLIAEVIRRRVAGEVLPDTDVIAQHGDLQPELGQELLLLGAIEAAKRAAEETTAASPKPASAVDPDVLAPMQIEGYEIEAEIGRGGMGVVYRARQLAAGGRVVAMKFMREDPFSSPARRQRFEREVAVASELHHPNIAEIYDSGLTRGQYFFVMQYVKGLPLDEYCEKHLLPLRSRLQLFQQVCEAVGYAHRKGVIHRDLKPNNILVDSDGIPHILDFGLAKLVDAGAIEPSPDRLSIDGVLLGTLPYMSPEQAAGKVNSIDTRTDVYALGVVLYQILTGEFPYEVLGQMALVLGNIAKAEPKRPSTLNRMIGNEVETIMLRALFKDPEQRYPTAGDLARDILHFLSGEPIEAKRASAWYQIRKLASRHQRVLVPFVALVIVSATIALISYFRIRSERDSAVEARAAADAARAVATAAQARSERDAYVIRITLCRQLLRENNFEELDKLLDACPASFRGWEWLRLKLVAHQERETLRSSPVDVVSSLAFSPDGSRIAFGGLVIGKSIHIWDVAGVKQLLELDGHRGLVEGLAYSADGSQLVSNSRDGTVRLWDANTGKLQNTFTSVKGQSTGSVTISHTGDAIAAAGMDAPATSPLVVGARPDRFVVRVWKRQPDARWSDAVVLPGLRGSGVVFTPDGKQLATSGTTATLWDVETLKEIWSAQIPASRVGALAISPDGKLLAGCLRDGRICVWTLAGEKEPIWLPAFGDEPTSVAFHPTDGTLVASYTDHLIRIWSLASARVTSVIQGHSQRVTSIAFSANGSLLASGSLDRTVKLWDYPLPSLDLAFQHPGGSNPRIAAHPQRPQIASAAGTSIVVWDLPNDKPRASYDGKLLGRALSVAYTFDGDSLITGWQDKTVRILALDGLKEIAKFTGLDSGVLRVAVSRDGKRIAASSELGEVRVWNRLDGSLIFMNRPDTKAIAGLTFSPDGRWLAATNQRAVALFDTIDPLAAPKGVVPSGKDALPQSIAFSPDGRLFAIGKWTGEIEIWNQESKSREALLTGHTAPVTGLCFSTGGERLASGSADKRVKVWNPIEGTELLTLEGHTMPVESLVFTRSGEWLIAAGGEIRAWRAGNPASRKFQPTSVGEVEPGSPSRLLRPTKGTNPNLAIAGR